ncbi:hypothetical protein [Anaerobutyricum hallii]|uniref:hypothetical protein n=1 Tax=Anaerobutyricum hallii TaxID=39488 RepID=UPI0026F32422|nr:hypothetical protein [Anaerobutyricum hallii]
MISLVQEDDIKYLTMTYLSNTDVNYILRILKVISCGGCRYYLFSFDYMNDKNKDCSLISYKNGGGTCTCCNHNTHGALLYLINGDLVTLCFDCLQRKHFHFSPELKTSLVASSLAKYNHADLLNKIFSHWDTEHKYYGYKVRNISKSGNTYYYLDFMDKYSLHSINPKVHFDVTFNQAKHLYLYNYLFLLSYLNSDTTKKTYYDNLISNFSPEELKEAKERLLLAGLDETKSHASQDFSTSQKESSFSQEQRQPTRAEGELGAQRPSCLTEGAKRRRESSNSQEITSIKSKSDNCLMVGQTYKNAKIKLQKIKKDKRGFFKGHYKHLYAIYYGNHSLLWNTNKDVEDGKYICTFTVQRSALTWGYMFINNCRLKKIEKE